MPIQRAINSVILKSPS